MTKVKVRVIEVSNCDFGFEVGDTFWVEEDYILHLPEKKLCAHAFQCLWPSIYAMAKARKPEKVMRRCIECEGGVVFELEIID